MVCSYLEKLLKEYLEEKNAIEKSITNLQVQLKENIEFLKIFGETQEVSFSPRDMNSKKKFEIQKLKEEQKDILKNLDELTKSQSDILQKIEELNAVLNAARSNAAKQKKMEASVQNELDRNEFRIALLETQEKERQRISRELHDSTVQNLTSLIHKTELCTKLTDKDLVRCKLELAMMTQRLREIINDTRQMIYNLRPMSFDDIGLEVTIERALDKLKADKLCNIKFTVEGEAYFIKPVIGITLLRIIQEACNNAIKYAEASIISVKLIYGKETITVLVEDDGKGFDVEHLDVSNRNDNSGFGLSMMKERVYLLSGEIKMTSMENDGTKIKVIVPIGNKEEIADGNKCNDCR